MLEKHGIAVVALLAGCMAAVAQQTSQVQLKIEPDQPDVDGKRENQVRWIRMWRFSTLDSRPSRRMRSRLMPLGPKHRTRSSGR